MKLESCIADMTIADIVRHACDADNPGEFGNVLNVHALANWWGVCCGN